MIFILGLLAIVVVCLVGHVLTDDNEFIWGGIGIIALCVFVVVTLVILPVSQMEVRAHIQEFHSVGLSLEAARVNPDISQLELAAIQREVIDRNRWLAKAKYLAVNPLVNWFWVKDVLELEPIR